MTGSPIRSGWEALRADPLPWLLDDEHPNLRWRTLVELVGRDPDSPAVRRARGGANAAEPLASLLAALRPDGSWDVGAADWHRFRGPAWRMVAALDLGADPEDPRLQAAAGRLLEEAVGEGGFAPRAGTDECPVVTARSLQMLCTLGWGRHLRVQEALAWLEEKAVAAARGPRGATVAVAALRAASECGREGLQEMAGEWLGRWIAGRSPRRAPSYGHPNLATTDELEILWALARAGGSFNDTLRPALGRLQEAADPAGRWWQGCPPPASLPVPEGAEPGPRPSRWITLRATEVITAHAVEAELPRRFPLPPGP